jgi:site-specific recombinase XerD
MSDKNLIGTWARRFLMEHLIGERNLGRNTQASYRDCLALLLPFAAAKAGRPVDRLLVDDIAVEHIRAFLSHLESDRGCSISTRNQRLAAIHALALFVAGHSPEYVAWCTQVRSIPFKRAPKGTLPYLDKVEMDSLLATPDRRTAQGLRDYALLLFLYNTGARADEAAHVTVGDLGFGGSPAVAKLFGKGRKERICPMWTVTEDVLKPMVAGRAPADRVFLNRRGEPLTRFGIYALVKRYVHKAGKSVPSLLGKRVSPHTIRHTTAVHLLRAGVDINTIRAWLGHVSIDTTNIYAEIDLEMKAKALAHCELPAPSGNPLRGSVGVMGFLRSL